MKTPEEIKQGLLCCSHSDVPCSACPYDGLCKVDTGQTPEDDAADLIDQLLTNYGHVSKALCGKENASPEELLQVIEQVKAHLAYAEKEKQALLYDLQFTCPMEFCEACKHAHEPDAKCETFDFECDECDRDQCPCRNCKGISNFEWRGLCQDNEP